MRVIIIGGVAAGMSAAAKLKRLQPDYEVVIYEKTDIISLGACGLPYYAGGFFDDPNELIARTPEEFRKSNIELNIFHEVVGLDTIHKQITIKNLRTEELIIDNYDKLMIATGASCIFPPIENLHLDNVTTLKSMSDGSKLRSILDDDNIKNIVIIGAGFIGIEAVEACKHKNKNITLIQLEDRILSNVFDEDITTLLEDEIRKHNVDLLLNESVTRIEGINRVSKVITNKREINADAVIIATGVKPNTEFLKYNSIDMLPNGAIIVDEYGRTNIKDIFSAGDCATIPNMITKENTYVPLATGANKLGRIVGENLAGNNIPFQGSLASSCIKVMDMEAASTGLTETKAKALGIDYKSTFISDYNQTTYYPGRNKIYIKLIYDNSTKRILGGQVAGFKDAVQRTNVIAAAILGNLTTSQLGMLDLCYAPPFSRTWDVLNVAGNVSR
ncbi:CoA-disulfide reductase [Clostridium sp. MSJ-8]|uniref:CoA-disulfide reductase n=1 Tax=Clostridium sp. MSJ-8 TaxID=2841510 RepID=UPI001C0ED8FA|nr:CoA-disulfide reductase [Clostridium sp. MSJ-8]MBU5487945.1 CoA-disulfide reductase [Clostridium sp. MSJ-8]